MLHLRNRPDFWRLFIKKLKLLFAHRRLLVVIIDAALRRPMSALGVGVGRAGDARTRPCAREARVVARTAPSPTFRPEIAVHARRHCAVRLHVQLLHVRRQIALVTRWRRASDACGV